MNPQFFIIAGPNGAGKSTYAHRHVTKGTNVFNGDAVYAELLRMYPGYDPEKLKGGVPHRLEKDRDEAMALRRNFAFETNYSTDLALEITDAFESAEYETNLVYFGLDSAEEASLRVDARFALGGHFVGTDEVAFNYNEGVKRVRDSMHRYDRVKFVDTGMGGEARVVAYWLKDGGRHAVLDSNIGWFNALFSDRLSEVVSQRTDKPRSRYATGNEARTEESRSLRSR